jgi:small subunit ribosomal protein S1
MVNHSLIAQIGVADSETEALLLEAFGDKLVDGNLDAVLGEELKDYKRGNILIGRVVGKAGDDVVVDVGLKSEGLINKNEFDDFDSLKPGDKIEVMLEGGPLRHARPAADVAADDHGGGHCGLTGGRCD